MTNRIKTLRSNYSRYCIGFSYIGKYFAGWHINDIPANIKDDSIQKINVSKCLENALLKFTNNNFENISFSSRTDAGVHALRNTFQVDILDKPSNNNKDILQSEENILNGINFHISLNYQSQIRIIDVTKVDEIFDARKDAKARTYMYRIVCPINNIKNDYTFSDNDSLFNHDRVWYVNQKLNILAMKQAIKHLLGEHDFSSFRSSNCDSFTPYRNIHFIDITSHNDHEYIDSSDDKFNFEVVGNLQNPNNMTICVWITANSFVFRMVRNIVGVLVDIGHQKILPDSIKDILELKDRSKVPSKCAPPHGLYLVDVHYDYSFANKFGIKIDGYKGNKGGE